MTKMFPLLLSGLTLTDVQPNPSQLDGRGELTSLNTDSAYLGKKLLAAAGTYTYF